MRNPLRLIAEQITDIARIWSPAPQLSALRNRMRSWGLHFWGQGKSLYEGTEVDFNTARRLYRNDGENALGSGFCRPIVDLQVAFIGLPHASLDDEDATEYLNEAIEIYWTDSLQQMFRDTLRDSKSIVRIHRPDIFDPLMTLEEAEHCQLEIIPPEKVEIERNAFNANIIERAVITKRMIFVVNKGNVGDGRDPQVEEHEVVEILSRENFILFDKTDNEELGRTNNKWGFVPILEVWNEFEAYLQGGMSEFEGVMPFIEALADVLNQGLEAHKYHSTPKVKFKLSDIYSFLKNNFPNSIDPTTGAIVPGSEISWRGREIIFMESDEDVGFVEATSVLGDTKTLAEFLIDLICIASQTPEWAFMRTEQGNSSSDRNAQTLPLVKKIHRKRHMFQKSVQQLLKMALVINDKIPQTAKISWQVVRLDDQLVEMQALQYLIMALEVAKQSDEISDATYREMIRSFIPAMKSASKEALDAAKDTTRASLAQPNPNGTQNGNQPSRVPVIQGGQQGSNE